MSRPKTQGKKDRKEAIEELAVEMEKMMVKALHPNALLTYLEGDQFPDERATLRLWEWTDKARLAMYGDGAEKKRELLRERLNQVPEYKELFEGKYPADIFAGWEYEQSMAYLLAGVLWGQRLAGVPMDEIKRTCRSIFEAYE